MRKPAVVFLTLIITALCIYYLSFTFVAGKFEREARQYAMNSDGVVDRMKKQAYEDSLWTKEVYLGKTFKEVKENEISFGLDLKGGMHVTLEVSPVDILRALAGKNPPPAFEQAIAKATEKQKNSQTRFSTLFFESLKEVAPDVKLADIFATASNKGRIEFNSTDEEIEDAIVAEIEDAIERALQIIKTRIDKFGVTQPVVQRIQGTGRLQIELPGVDNPARVRKLLQGVAQLEFYEVYTAAEYDPIIGNINQMLVKKAKAEKALGGQLVEGDTAKKEQLLEGDTTKKTADEQLIEGDTTKKAEQDSTQIADNAEISELFKMMRGFQPLTFETKDTGAVNAIFSQEDVKALLPSNVKLSWGVKPFTGTDGVSYVYLYVLKTRRGGEAPLAGDVIVDARNSYDELGNPDVTMQMNVQGAKEWKKLTRENKGRQVAIVLDNYVYSAPNVREEIPNGRSSISGGFTLEEAMDLANILKAGKLPAPTRIVEEAVVGPTLGLKAQESGIISVVAGLAIVVLFMIAYYSKGGLVANIALVFNIFFIVGILAQLHAALTLPGIAGIVLTMGMSIDANVLIFERIREELRATPGQLINAINQGYDRAFWTIFDSNITTFITGLFLFAFGSGPVKGFAVTLMIGIACSFFSAVFITREIVHWMTKRGDASNISFNSIFSSAHIDTPTVDYISKRKIAYGFSIAIIVVGWAIIAFQGLNLGVDFKGGRSYQVNFAKSFAASDMKAALADDFEGTGVEVKTFGNDMTFKVTTSYLIDDESEAGDAKVLSALIKGLEAFSGEKYTEADKEATAGTFTVPSTAKVGSTIADDITDSARNAVIFSLLGIFLYVWLRFRKWEFGMGAVVALFHDVLIVFSVFAIARALGISYEIDQIFVAAMLTVIGYSINDTVVVFDRIREFVSNEGAENFDGTLNRAINGTLNRTLITSLTTLLVVVILFAFGGEVLRGFSFALLVGIGFGTYSSIFIATPVVYDSLKLSKGDASELAVKKVVKEEVDGEEFGTQA